MGRAYPLRVVGVAMTYLANRPPRSITIANVLASSVGETLHGTTPTTSRNGIAYIAMRPKRLSHSVPLPTFLRGTMDGEPKPVPAPETAYFGVLYESMVA